MGRSSCQFYVILGNDSFVSGDSYNVYINVSDKDITNTKLLVDRLTELYNEKYQDNIPVNDKIIFKIFDEKYRNVALKIMDVTGIVGVVEYNYKENNSINEISDYNRGVVDNAASRNKSVTSDRDNPVRPDTLIFYKDDFAGDSGSRVQPGNVTGKSNSNVKSLKKSTNKKSGIVSLPVLIFIFSTMLLIASFVLLFIMD